MTIDQIREFFMWCLIINTGVLMCWFGMILVAHDWVYRCHSRFFKLSPESFDTIHYCGMGLFKLLIFFFNAIPFIVLLIVGGK